MPTVSHRTYSHHTSAALALLGKLIRLGRLQRRMTAQELADRVGVSRSTLRRIEMGDAKVEVGLMFETAAVVGVHLFDADATGLKGLADRTADRIALLPKYVYKTAAQVDDDF